MKKEFISGQELLAKRWTAIDEGELLEIIESCNPTGLFFREGMLVYGSCLQVYHPSYKPILCLDLPGFSDPPSNVDQVPFVIHSIAELFPFLRKCFFKIAEIEQVEKRKPALRNVKPIQHDTTLTDPVVITHLKKIGKKGGGQLKINQPILKAAIEYMKETQKTKDKSNRGIANNFCKKYNENKPMPATIDGAKWEVFCSGDHIFSRLVEFGSKSSDNRVKSITCTTFLNNYITKAKNSIKPLINQ